ncbi:hypothetical protein [Inediibacterium massiliense]|nr:hypothetical protein [Inediibacterium massiliense]
MLWLIEYEIVGLCDNIDHDKMMKAVEKKVKEIIENFKNSMCLGG